MYAIFFTILGLIGMASSTYIIVKKRNESGVTGWKTLVPSVSFLLIAVINMVVFWINQIGVISWFLTTVLLMVGAYFTKYLPKPPK